MLWADVVWNWWEEAIALRPSVWHTGQTFLRLKWRQRVMKWNEGRKSGKCSGGLVRTKVCLNVQRELSTGISRWDFFYGFDCCSIEKMGGGSRSTIMTGEDLSFKVKNKLCRQSRHSRRHKTGFCWFAEHNAYWFLCMNLQLSYLMNWSSKHRCLWLECKSRKGEMQQWLDVCPKLFWLEKNRNHYYYR